MGMEDEMNPRKPKILTLYLRLIDFLVLGAACQRIAMSLCSQCTQPAYFYRHAQKCQDFVFPHICRLMYVHLASLLQNI